MFFQLLFNGLIIGSIYALVALGFSFIYTTNRFVHFAHGSTITVAAYLFFWLLEYWQWPLGLAIVFVILFAGLLGWLVQQVIYLPLKKRAAAGSTLLVASIGLMIILNNLMQLLFGADVKILSVVPENTGLVLVGAYVTTLQLVIVGLAAAMLVAAWLFTNYCSLGRKLKAVADNPELSKISGINTTLMESWSFFIGSALAGLAAVLIALEFNIEPTMGTNFMISGFTAAVIGGINSLFGSMLGSYLLGLVENFGIWFLPSSYKTAITFILLLLFLLIRPQGILGVNKGIREQKL